jgi:hypothetical protein
MGRMGDDGCWTSPGLWVPFFRLLHGPEPDQAGLGKPPRPRRNRPEKRKNRQASVLHEISREIEAACWSHCTLTVRWRETNFFTLGCVKVSWHRRATYLHMYESHSTSVSMRYKAARWCTNAGCLACIRQQPTEGHSFFLQGSVPPSSASVITTKVRSLTAVGSLPSC